MDSSEFLEQLKQRFNSIAFERKETEHELEVLVVTEEPKPYNFYIWIEGGWTIMDIGATLKSEPSKYFWYQSWENFYDVDTKWIDELLETATDQLEILLNKKTRVIQRKGLLASSFECQYMNSEWAKLSKNRALHSNLELPKISGRKKVYE
ncbi:MAG: hypothetical protein ABJF11_06750 [Reichenbachiella sp.]|uniref:hypothetical protein n=1 Tax=Reichenbachiella sp. TaxID=2184521 RepID=UPI0032638B3E